MNPMREHTERWTVRTYEGDENGHVNNAVYVQWAELTSVSGVRGRRQTTIRRVADGTLLAEIASGWVWVRLSDGRPSAVPREIVDAYRSEEG